MEAFGHFLWPPVTQTAQQKKAGGTDSDTEDLMHVEQLVQPGEQQSDHRDVAQHLLSTPAITLNNVPVHDTTGNVTLPSPTSNGNSIFVFNGSGGRGGSRTPSRTPSPTIGSKRNTPRHSPERQGGQSESEGSKVRLINVPDVQQETWLVELKNHQLIRSNQLFENIQKELAQMKETAEATKGLAESAEKRAYQAEQALGKERLEAQKSLQKLQADIGENASKLMHETERRVEVTLKSIKSTQSIAHFGPVMQSPVDDMMVDHEHPRVPAPPRFPEPASTSLPKPLSFRRPKSIGKTARVPPSNTFLQSLQNQLGDSSSSSEDEEKNTSQQKPTANFSDLNGEEMLRLLLTNMGVDITNAGSLHKFGKRWAHREFREPAKKAPKAKGKQDLMNWLRQQLHSLLEIEKSRDILKFASEIYSDNTPNQRQMEHWEKTKEGDAPKVKPMKINWKNFEGPWNTHLCELFVQYCCSQGFEGGTPSDDAREFVAGYFWERLSRLRTILKKNRPKESENFEQTSARTEEQHLQALSVARRNSRRNQKHQDRLDICLENLPDNLQSISSDEQRDWKVKYNIVAALGPEGMSSDETGDSDTDTYWVRTLPWRNKRAVQVMVSIDEAKNTRNAYGNIRPGNRPRNRQRKKSARESVRKAPIGKPKNLYDTDWFEKLHGGKKRALKAKSDIDYE
ncbi:hypothetical protein CVT26_011470 [Gymnopilus dilepis]|uniref:Uncharacterized protein n=1 Tax=Gymnopilus dilepis TaxID=231916 RepID=A0A409W8Q2_9AGAR|nr:hypothetical protein CVT26_011470 [Gymnopilus dilepis]